MGYFVTLFLIVIVFKTIWEIVIDYINLRYSTGPDAKIPDILKDRISVEDFEKSKKYLKDTTYFGIVGSLVSLTVDIVFVLKLFPVLEHALSGKWSLSIQALLFFGIYTLIDYLVGLPFSIYSTFVIEEKYGFNTTKPRLFFKDQMLNVLLTVLLGIPVLLVLMWLLSYPIWWWQVSLFAIALVVFISFVQPVLIAPLFYKFSKLENEELERKLRDLLEKAKVKVPNIYKIDASKRTKKQNAYLTGIGKSRRLVLFDTILTYSDDEILAIVGHELGHHVRRHIPKLILTNSVYITLILYLTNLVYDFIKANNVFGVSQPYTVFLYALMFITSIIFFAEPLINYFSRKMEYEADEYSAKLIGSPEPLISSLKRLVKENLSNPNPAPIYKIWHYTHPAPEERIKRLAELKN